MEHENPTIERYDQGRPEIVEQGSMLNFLIWKNLGYFFGSLKKL